MTLQAPLPGAVDLLRRPKFDRCCPAAFQHSRSSQLCCRSQQDSSKPSMHCDVSRRAALLAAVLLPAMAQPAGALVQGYTPMEGLKGKDYGKARMSYSDYVTTPSGLQYQDLVEGKGPTPSRGSTVVIDWDGYTIGYYGRPFEARNKAKGGSFTGDDKDYFKFVVGANQVIPGIEEAVASMKQGSIRRIIVPEELGYPDNDLNKKGPSPSTFSGQRTLDFVLKNKGLIDKTLLFDVELMKVIN